MRVHIQIYATDEEISSGEAGELVSAIQFELDVCSCPAGGEAGYEIIHENSNA